MTALALTVGALAFVGVAYLALEARRKRTIRDAYLRRVLG